MKKKNVVVIVAVLLIVIIYAGFSFTKKPQPKYITADVAMGEVLQTVSVTGTVDAAKKLDLRFVNSGKINQINVKSDGSIVPASGLWNCACKPLLFKQIIQF